MLPAIIAAIGLAAQIGSSIYSNKKSAEANRKMQETSNAAYNQQNAEAEQLKVSEGDFMNTALGKNMIENLRRQYSDAWKRDVSGGLKGGRTDEAKLASATNLNDAYARNLAHIAAIGTQYREHVLSQAQELKNAARNRKFNADMSLLNADNQSALNIADNGLKIGSGLINVAGSFDGKTVKGKGKVGGTQIGTQPPDFQSILDYNDEMDLLKQTNNYGLNNPFKNLIT
jgi:hypothetical protein